MVTAPAGVTAPSWLAGERLSPALAGVLGAAGGVLVLVGVLALFAELPAGDERIGGIALSLVALVTGAVALALGRERAVVSAGVVVTAGSIPPLVGLLVFEPAGSVDKTDLALSGLLAVVAWAALFLAGPARGHGLYLGLALVTAWFAATSLTVPDRLFSLGRAGFLPIPAEPAPPPPELQPPGASPVPPNPGTAPILPDEAVGGGLEPAPLPSFQTEEDDETVAPGLVSLGFGVVYLAAGFLLDRRLLRRVATPFFAVGDVVLVLGVLGLGPQSGEVLTGALATAAGGGLIWLGSLHGRRFTAWLGVVLTAGGVLTLVGAATDEPLLGAALLLLLGVGTVVGALALDRWRGPRRLAPGSTSP